MNRLTRTCSGRWEYPERDEPTAPVIGRGARPCAGICPCEEAGRGGSQGDGGAPRFREANRPNTAPAEGEKPDAATRDVALAKALAESPGIEESKVTAALEELRSERQAEKAAELKRRVDQAVTDGKLRQAEADAVTKAVVNGVMWGRRTEVPGFEAIRADASGTGGVWNERSPREISRGLLLLQGEPPAARPWNLRGRAEQCP